MTGSGNAAVAAPVVSLGATATPGGTFSAGMYFWKIVATAANSTSVGSNEVTATLAANGTRVLTWPAVQYPTRDKVYRGT